jgi:hypothetical protein
MGAGSGPGRGEFFYQNALMTVGDKLHEWTRVFEGQTIKPLNQNDAGTVRGCLEAFAPMERGLVMALNSNELSIERLYADPRLRRLLVQHIVALNVHFSVFSPFFVGLDGNVSQFLSEITNELYRERISILKY